MNEEIIGIEVSGEVYPIKDEKTNEKTQTLESKVSSTEEKIANLESALNKTVGFPDYTNQIIITSNSWVADRDVYINMMFVSLNQAANEFTINGVQVGATDSSTQIQTGENVVVQQFSGYVKKGSIIAGERITDTNTLKIYPLLQ